MEEDQDGRLDALERRVADLEERAAKDLRSARLKRWAFLVALLVYLLYLYKVTSLL